MSQLCYSVSVLRHLARNVTGLLDTNVLSTCRHLSLIKKKTARGVRGGRKVKKIQITCPQFLDSVPQTVESTDTCDSPSLLPESLQSSSLLNSPVFDAPCVSPPSAPLSSPVLAHSESSPLLPFQFAALSPEFQSVTGIDDQVGGSVLDSSCSSMLGKSPLGSQLLVGLLNAQSTSKKAADIHDLVVEKSLDVLVMTETWLREAGDEVVITQMTPAGFKFMHQPRRSGRDGGGIAIVYKKSIIVKRLLDEIYRTFETLRFTLTHGKVTYHGMCVYHPPYSRTNRVTNAMFINEFSPVASALAVAHKYILILGDINIHFDVPSDPDTRRMCQLLDSLDLTQFVTVPTHIKGHILDWVISGSTLNAVRSVVVEKLQLSDHFLVIITTNMSRPKRQTKIIHTRNLKEMDTDSFRSDLQKSALLVSPPDDVDQLVSLYNSTLSSLLDTYAPVVQKCIVERPNTAWFTPAVRRAKRARRRAERRWRRTSLEVDRQSYCQARNKCTVEINQARAHYVSDLLHSVSSDPKKMFSVVNGLLGKDVSPPVLPEMDNQTAANTLSAFFEDKVKAIRDGFDNCRDAHQSAGNLFAGTALSAFQPVTEDELSKIIRHCSPTSSPVDPVPTKVMLDHLDILLPVLVLIVNASLSSSSVPALFKTAAVKPLLKKHNLDPNEIKNYRPISNLPYVSKLIERVVAQQLISYLDQQNLLDKFQSAYRPKHSCETALLRLMNDLLCSADAGKLTLLVLLDLSAAFDVIDHHTLLTRLRTEAGIIGPALEWFHSYLSRRSHRVIVGEAFSPERPVVCGVPQGSVLGPLLFSLYTAQLGLIIEKHGLSRKMFADDTELYRSFMPDVASACKAVEAVEGCCAEVKTWMMANKLKLNDEKTEALVCGSKSSLGKVSVGTIQVGQTSIPLSACARNLGLYVDSQLTMSAHVNSMVKACYFHIRTIGRLRPLLNRQTANAVAVSLVLSRLDYCNSCLWGISKSDLQKLQRVQNTAARIVMRKKKTDHITPVLRELHWLPVEKRIEHKVLSITYNCLNDAAPKYLQELISRHQPQRNLRSASQCRLQIPSVYTGNTNKKTMGFRAFTNTAPTLWNEIPLSIKQCHTSAAFRKALKTHLFSAE